MKRYIGSVEDAFNSYELEQLTRAAFEAGQDDQYEDPEWAGQAFNWEEPLVETARKVTVML